MKGVEPMLNYQEDTLLVCDGKVEYDDKKLSMDGILKMLFTLNNKRPIIDFLNSIYGDELTYSAQLTYPNVENFYNNDRNKIIEFRADLYIEAEENGKIYDYAIEFQTVFEESMAIRIFRYGFEKAVRDYTLVNKNVIEINLPEPYLIVIEETENLESSISLKIRVSKGNTLNYKINVLKYWEYDFKKLYEENKYLLYPLQLFKYRKHMERINRRKNTENKERAICELNIIISKTIRDTLEAIDTAYNCGKITLKDYDIMVSAIQNLNDYFIERYEYYVGLSQEVKNMVTSFYNPEIKKEGVIEGKKEDILDFLRDLGDVPHNIFKLVDEEEDIEKLKIWLKLAARSKSISEFEENM